MKLFQHDKDIYEISIADIMEWWKTEFFSLQHQEQVFNIILEILASVMRQEIKSFQVGKKEVRLFIWR